MRHVTLGATSKSVTKEEATQHVHLHVCVFEGPPCAQDTSPPLEMFCIELLPFIPPLVVAAWLLMALNGLFSTLVFTC